MKSLHLQVIHLVAWVVMALMAISVCEARKTEKPVWRIVTETTDREHSDAAMEIAKKIASEMNSAGL